ncbi:MAG: sigma 54-interacting transcriptional regulator, partial [Myxococcota bacterium]
MTAAWLAFGQGDYAKALASVKGMDDWRAAELGGWVALYAADREKARHLAQSAMGGGVDREGRVRQARLQLLRGMALGLEGAPALGRAEALATSAGAEPLAATALANAGSLLLHLGKLGLAKDALSAAAERHLRLGRHGDGGRALNNLARLELLIGELAAAEHHLELARTTAERAGDARAAELALEGALEARLARAQVGGLEEAARSLTDDEARARIAFVAARRFPELAERLRLRRGDVIDLLTQSHIALATGEREGRARLADAIVERRSEAGFEYELRAALVLSELRPSERERWLEEGRRLLDFASRDLNPTSRQRLRQVPAFERAFSVAGPEGRELEGWRVQRWRRFAAATRDVISAGDAELAMTRLLEGSLALLDGERASWIEREAGALVLRAAAGAVVGEEAFSRSIVQRALDTRACVTAANAMEEGDFGGASVHALSLRSVLAVPVGEGEAVLYLEDRLRPAAYDERDGALLEAFADLGSLVLAARRREGRTVAERLRAQELRQRAEALAAEQASELRQRRSEMIADSPAMKRVLELSARVATSDAAALITGESGSGKGELARHIHALSERASGPLLAQNCAVIPEGLIESVLFGHVRGAFTGADEDRAGLFEAASGGTLFLD